MGKVAGFALVTLGALGGASYVSYKAIKYITTDKSAKKAFKSYVSDKFDAIYRKSNESTYSYSQYYNNRLRYVYNYDDIVFDDRSDAEKTLMRMDEIVNMYGVVTVADMYDLVGATCKWIDNKYGWTDIRKSTILSIPGGYIIDLPKPSRVY